MLTSQGLSGFLLTNDLQAPISAGGNTCQRALPSRTAFSQFLT